MVHEAKPLYRRWPQRLRYFLYLFLPLLIATQLFVFTQPAIFRSQATILTTAGTAVDRNSQDADLQHVNIQKDLLLGQDILDKTARILQVPADELRAQLSVSAVAQTNLLTLSAEGSQPLFLQKAVNAWIAAYLKSRSDYVSNVSDQLNTTLQGELQRIAQQISAKRQEIDGFRLNHNIQSDDSADNQAHARLQGLNESLNKAVEQEVLAKARMDAIHNAIQQGKTVVPDADTQSIAVMTEQVGKLQEKLDELRGNYTDEYIRFNPTMRKIPEQLADLQNKIEVRLKAGAAQAVQDAENNYAAAHEALQSIQTQMALHKKVAADFTGQFARLQAMQQELATMETRQNETRERLMDLEVKQRDKYPQVEVIDSATLPARSIRPDYAMEAALGFAVSLAGGLLLVWLMDYLRREERPPLPIQNTVQVQLTATPADSLLANIRPETAVLEGHAMRPVLTAPDIAGSLGVEHDSRTLQRQEVAAMYDNADLRTTEILSLLLNGLTAAEIRALDGGCFDLDRRTINVPGRDRVLAMNRYTFALLSAYPWQPIAQEAADMDALLAVAARDAGLTDPEQIGCETLRYTYLLFLLGQGIKLGELGKIAGPINPGRLMLMGRFAPADKKLTAEEVDLDLMLAEHRA